MKTVRYLQSLATTSPAAGVTGFLLRGPSGSFLFRVYEPTGKFVDYEIRHDDLEVTISGEALGSFYHVGERRILDHSPDVLGLQWVLNDEQA